MSWMARGAGQVDRGRRHVSIKEQHKEWDFLKNPHARPNTDPIGKGSENSKFKKGFKRRPQAAIRQDAPRHKHEEYVHQRHEREFAARKERLTFQFSRHGNLINGRGMPKEAATARKHFDHSLSKEMQHENRIRQRVGSARFHVEQDAKMKRSAEFMNTRKAKQQVQASSMLGYGRADVLSMGVVDNFRSGGYEGKPPKMLKEHATRTDRSISKVFPPPGPDPLAGKAAAKPYVVKAPF